MRRSIIHTEVPTMPGIEQEIIADQRVPFSTHSAANQFFTEAAPLSPACQLLNPLLHKLSRRDSQRSRLMTRSSSFLMASHGQDTNLRTEAPSSSFIQQDPLSSPKRKSQVMGEVPLKFLNKSKMSYRDVMEG
jgi:hypothetical protein